MVEGRRYLRKRKPAAVEDIKDMRIDRATAANMLLVGDLIEGVEVSITELTGRAVSRYPGKVLVSVTYGDDPGRGERSSIFDVRLRRLGAAQRKASVGRR